MAEVVNADKPRLVVWWKDEFDEHQKPEDAQFLEGCAWKVPDQSRIFDDKLYRVEDVQVAAELYAEYFYDNRDGHEDSWPLDFVVFDGERYWAVEVDLAYTVEFGALGEPTELTNEEKEAAHAG